MISRTLLCTALLAIAVIAQFTVRAQDIEYTPIISTGDTVMPAWATESSTIAGISDPIWVGPRVALRFTDTGNRSYSAYWDAFTQKIEYAAGPGLAFPSFGSNSSPKNRDGDPPISPYIQSGLHLVAEKAGIFAGKAPVEDAGTPRQEVWNALITASYSSLTQWQEPFHGNPLMISPNGDYAYVEDYGDNGNQLAWVYENGGSEVIHDPSIEPSVPSDLTNASHFFPGTPIRITANDELILTSSYNKIDNTGAGYAFYCVTIDSIMYLLVSSDTPIPEHSDIPSGGTWLISDNAIAASENGKVYFNATIRETGVFIRRTIWSVTKDTALNPTLELTSDLEYETTNSGLTQFTQFSTPHTDDSSNIYFEAQVDGEQDDSIWKKAANGELTRLSPPNRSQAPGVEGFTMTDARIAAVSPNGKLVAYFNALESNGFRGYYLQDSNGNWALIARNGQPLENFGDSIEVKSFDFNFEDELAMIIRIGFDYKLLYVRNLSDLTPTGNAYNWDGGAGDNNWHTVVDGRSNWVDNLGVPWPTPPQGPETWALIDTDYLVEISEEAIHISDIHLTGASLVNNGVSIALEESLMMDEDSSLTLKAGTVSGSLLHSAGTIIKEGSGAASITTDYFTLFEADLSVEEGTLSILSKSEFQDAGILVEGGKLILGDEITLLGNHGVDLTTTTTGDALIIPDDTSLIFKADLTLNLGVDSIATIGDGISASPITFTDPREEGTFIQIEINGDGQLQVLTPLALDHTIEIHNKAGSATTPGLLLNTKTQNTLHNVSNTGYAKITSGGFSGSLTNQGTFDIDHEQVPEAPFLIESLTNLGTLNQKGSFTTAYFRSANNAKHIFSSDVDETITIAPKPLTVNPTITYEHGSNLTIKDGSLSIDLGSEDPWNFQTNFTILEGAALQVIDIRRDLPIDIEIPKDASLTVNGGYIRGIKTKGKGSTHLKGPILFAGGATVNDFISTSHFSLEGSIANSENDSPALLFLATIKADEETPVNTFTNVSIGLSMNVILTIGTTAKSESPIDIDGHLHVFGKLIFEDSIDGDGDLTIFEEGILEANPQNDKIEISPNLELTVSSQIKLKDNSELTINNVSSPRSEWLAGEIYGAWTIGDHSACEIKDPLLKDGISTILKGSSITLNRPHATLPSLVDLPNTTNHLINHGSLTINNTALNVAGGSFTSHGDFDIGPGAELIGDIKSIRHEVQGTPVLAGNLNIQGNLESNGVISLGASPGQGLITGNLILHPESEMRVEFAGTTPGTEFDFLEVQGTANLDGKLTLALIDDYLPDASQTFNYIEAGTISGSFSEIDQNEMGRLRRFGLSETANTLTATTIEIAQASYQDFAALYFDETELADDTISGLLADPDKDGLPNLLEYLTYTIPTLYSENPFTLADPQTQSFILQLASNISDYTWTLETSPNLAEWTDALPTIADLFQETEYQVFTLTPTSSTTPKRFYRIKITSTP